jgi:hypothetical protein
LPTFGNARTLLESRVLAGGCQQPELSNVGNLGNVGNVGNEEQCF